MELFQQDSGEQLLPFQEEQAETNLFVAEFVDPAVQVKIYQSTRIRGAAGRRQPGALFFQADCVDPPSSALTFCI